MQTPASPPALLPAYETEDLTDHTDNFNNLQYFAQHQGDMLIYRSDYQIFDNSWRTWKPLERTKCQLQNNINQIKLTIEHTEQQQQFLMQQANCYYQVLYTPKIQWRIEEPEMVGEFLHSNTPSPHV